MEDRSAHAHDERPNRAADTRTPPPSHGGNTRDGQPTGRTGREGAVMRPVALPDDIDDPRIEKASGAVELPLHVYWSGGPRTWNLDNRRQRVHLYQIVMREGTDEDVSAFIDLDELIRLWNDLYLPEYVREAWIAFVRAKRSIDLPGRSGPGTPVPPSP